MLTIRNELLNSLGSITYQWIIVLVSSGFESIDMVEVVDQFDAYDPVTSDLMHTQLRNLFSMQSIIAHVDGSDEF